MPTLDELKELEEASEAAGDAASLLLDTNLKTVRSHVARIHELKPKTADEATYRQLVAIVVEATAKNESVAAMRARVEQLGEGAVAMLDQMAKLAGKIL